MKLRIVICIALVILIAALTVKYVEVRNRIEAKPDNKTEQVKTLNEMRPAPCDVGMVRDNSPNFCEGEDNASTS